MTLRSCNHCIYRIDDPMQCTVRPNRHIGPAKIVVDRADQTHNVNVRTFGEFLRGNRALVD